MRCFKLYSDIPSKVWLILSALFIDRVGTMLMFFFTLYLQINLHFTIAQIGLTMTMYGIGCILGSFGGSYLCNYFSPQKLASCNFILNGIFIFLLSCFSNLIIIKLILIQIGFLTGAISPSIQLMLLEHTNINNRIRIYALARSISNLGMSIAGAVGGIISTSSFKALFYLDGVTNILAGFILMLFCRTQVKIVKKTIEMSKDNFINLLRSRFFLSICMSVLVAQTIFHQYKTSYPIYLHEYYTISLSQFGSLFTINGIIIVLFQVPLLHYLSKYNQLIIAGIGSLLLGLGFSILPLGTSFIFAIFSCIIWTFGEIMTFSTISVIIFNQVEHKNNKGIYMSLYYLTLNIPNLTAPLIGTVIYNMYNWNTLWMLCGVFGVLLLLGFYLIDKSTRY